MAYTQKELREYSTERLLVALVHSGSSMNKSAKKDEDNIFKVLAERNVINYDDMKTEYERCGMW